MEAETDPIYFSTAGFQILKIYQWEKLAKMDKLTETDPIYFSTLAYVSTGLEGKMEQLIQLTFLDE